MNPLALAFVTSFFGLAATDCTLDLVFVIITIVIRIRVIGSVTIVASVVASPAIAVLTVAIVVSSVNASPVIVALASIRSAVLPRPSAASCSGIVLAVLAQIAVASPRGPSLNRPVVV